MAKFVSINTYRKDVSSVGRHSILLNIDQIIYIGNDYKNDVEIVHLVDGKTIWLERNEIEKIIRASSASTQNNRFDHIPDRSER